MIIITIIMIMVVTIWIQNDEINVLQWQMWQMIYTCKNFCTKITWIFKMIYKNRLNCWNLLDQIPYIKEDLVLLLAILF